MRTFKEFVNKKKRKAIRELNIIQGLLQQGGLIVHPFLEEQDPYIFLENPSRATEFEGVRIYKVGDELAYRVQKEQKTHPYGNPYSLDIEEMFDDLIADHKKEEEAAKEIIETVIDEFKRFFEKSAEAEAELRRSEYDQDRSSSSQVAISSTGTDYSNIVFNKGN